MRGRDNTAWGVIGSLGLLIWIIIQTFKGNFTPILVILGLGMLIYGYIKYHELIYPDTTKKKKEKIDNTIEKPIIIVDTNTKFNYVKLVWIILIVGAIALAFVANDLPSGDPSSKSSQEVVDNNEFSKPEVSTTNIAIVGPVKWFDNDFENTKFQLPENFILDGKSVTNNSRLYVDYTSNNSITLVSELLSDEMKDKTVDDFMPNISSYAHEINEQSRKNFDDIKLLNYELRHFGNREAIRIEQSSTKVSGLKGVEMIIISYHVFSNSKYYKITFSCPKGNLEFLQIFEKINKTFDFNNSSLNDGISSDDNNDSNLGFYKIVPDSIDKVYFYDNPDESFKRKAYLVGGELVKVLKTDTNFGYIEYTNPRGLTSKGWVKMNFLIK